MPPAIIPALIAGVVGIGSMINGNVQQKAAIKNNETQQASAVANAKGATQNAQKQMADYTAANPAPTQAPQAAPAAAKSAAPAGGPLATLSQNPQVAAILNSAQTGASAPSMSSAGAGGASIFTPPGGAATTSGNSTANLISRILGHAAA